MNEHQGAFLRFPLGEWAIAVLDALRPNVTRLGALGLAVGLLAPTSSAQDLAALEVELTALDAAPFDEFARSVSLDGTRAAVGAWRDDDLGVNSGSVYVFRRLGHTWVQEAKVTAPDGAAGDWFGHAVALAGDRLLVGAPLADVDGEVDAGAAFVYRRLGALWIYEDTLLAPSPRAGDEFGLALDLDFTRAAVGAWRADEAGADSGVVHTYTQIGVGNWKHERRLVSSDLAADDRLGRSVALDGSRLLAGASRDNWGSWVDAGSATLWRLSGSQWIQEAKLTATDPFHDDRFGYSVDLDGARALIGARHEGTFGLKSGAAYTFTKTGSSWSQEAKLLGQEQQAGDSFGTVVCLDGDLLVAGAPGHGAAGGSFVFERGPNGWQQRERLLPMSGGLKQGFGYHAALLDDTLLVGARSADSEGTDAGQASAFRLRASLASDRVEVSLKQGGSQHLSLDAGVQHAGRVYLVMGSQGGTFPGLLVGGVLLPLNYDGAQGYLVHTALAPLAPPLHGALGVLDADGRGSARFDVPPGSDPGLAGARLHHAFVVYDANLDLVYGSNPVVVELVP